MSSTPGDLQAHLQGLVVTRLWALLDGFEARLARALEPMGLTVAGYRLVGEVMRSPEGLTQSELARRLGVRPPTVSAAVSQLQAAGVIERRPDPGDARAYRIHLAGDAQLGPGVAVLETLEAELVGTLDEADRARLLTLLEQVAGRLQAP